MASDDTKFSSQSLDRRSFNDTFGMYEHIAYGVDGSNVTALDGGGFKKSSNTTIFIDESGTTTTITETDGAKTLTTTIDESTNPISITKVWS